MVCLLLSLAFFVLCSCGKSKGDDASLLINADWEGNDGSCTNSITFFEDGGFSNSCACGSPVGDGDCVDSFLYNKREKTVALYSEGEIMETAKILFLDDMYLVIDVWGKAYSYQNNDAAYLPEINEAVKQQTTLEDTIKPCLSVLEFGGEELIVSSYEYDRDSAALFEEWTLKAAEDITFDSISVTIENNETKIDYYTLTKEDYQYVGEYYTGGYFYFNDAGEVEHITFYGELIIY